MKIEIVPGKSLGALKLGAARRELPSGVVMEHETGTLDGAHFILEHDIVHEIWIEDLRTLPHEVRYEGRTVDRRATVSQLEELFGPCSHEQVLGGTRLMCASGIQLGIGSAGPNETLQIRVRRG